LVPVAGAERLVDATMASRNRQLPGAKQSGIDRSTRPQMLGGSNAAKIIANVPPSEWPIKNGVFAVCPPGHRRDRLADRSHRIIGKASVYIAGQRRHRRDPRCRSALLRPTSDDLASLFMRQYEAGAILANDTSCGVGYAPLSLLEKAVYATERHLYGLAMKCAHPEIGSDIKVIGGLRY
jgi:hypothetical protein